MAKKEQNQSENVCVFGGVNGEIKCKENWTLSPKDKDHATVKNEMNRNNTENSKAVTSKATLSLNSPGRGGKSRGQGRGQGQGRGSKCDSAAKGISGRRQSIGGARIEDSSYTCGSADLVSQNLDALSRDVPADMDAVAEDKKTRGQRKKRKEFVDVDFEDLGILDDSSSSEYNPPKDEMQSDSHFTDYEESPKRARKKKENANKTNNPKKKRRKFVKSGEERMINKDAALNADAVLDFMMPGFSDMLAPEPSTSKLKMRKGRENVRGKGRRKHQVPEVSSERDFMTSYSEKPAPESSTSRTPKKRKREKSVRGRGRKEQQVPKVTSETEHVDESDDLDDETDDTIIQETIRHGDPYSVTGWYFCNLLFYDFHTLFYA